MNWITNFVRPKIKALMQKSDTQENLWHKCVSCEQMLFAKDFEENLWICRYCGHHERLNAEKRLNTLMDKGFRRVSLPKVALDPLKFKDSKKYTDRLKEAQQKTKQDDAFLIAEGTINDVDVVVGAFDFDFMGGSMGTALGEGFVLAVNMALQKNKAFICVTSSGGARMQEGILSLMQMAKTTAAIVLLKEAKIPYIVLLSDPTTGGVSASLAMLGDIAISEPGALIAFTGARVIQETMREKLPDDFQKSEYLLDHGMIDRVIPRHELKNEISTMIRILQKKS